MRMQVTVNEVIDADISIDEVLNQLPGDDYDREWIGGERVQVVISMLSRCMKGFAIPDKMIALLSEPARKQIAKYAESRPSSATRSTPTGVALVSAVSAALSSREDGVKFERNGQCH